MSDIYEQLNEACKQFGKNVGESLKEINDLIATSNKKENGMSKKYVIEIKPEYEDTTRGVMVLGARESNLYVDMLSIEDLEELNSDYINEHFSDLKDTAYQKGFEDGKNSIENGCDGCKYEDQHGYDEPCNKCMHAHASHYTPMPKDEICFGDEVVDIDGEKGIVVSRNNDCGGAIWVLLKEYRVPQQMDKDRFRKTGVHMDIDSYFEAMQDVTER